MINICKHFSQDRIIRQTQITKVGRALQSNELLHFIPTPPFLEEYYFDVPQSVQCRHKPVPRMAIQANNTIEPSMYLHRHLQRESGLRKDRQRWNQRKLLQRTHADLVRLSWPWRHTTTRMRKRYHIVESKKQWHLDSWLLSQWSKSYRATRAQRSDRHSRCVFGLVASNTTKRKKCMDSERIWFRVNCLVTAGGTRFPT